MTEMEKREGMQEPALRQEEQRRVENEQRAQLMEQQGRTRPPSTVLVQNDLAQITVDQWGQRGEFTRGIIVSRGEAEQAGFDFDHAVRVGAIRLLTHAEARQGSWPTTTPLDVAGYPDEDFQRGMQFHAGVVTELPRTVTTEQGPPEPPHLAKPTIPFQGQDQPAARPIEVADARAAETAGMQTARVIPTSAGMAFATPQESEEVARAEEEGQPAQVAESDVRQQEEQQQSGEQSPANEQRVQRRGRRE
jgi:hypothetical protein